jgi:hypothetical protein
MYQTYERPKTPTRFNNSTQARNIETSPFRDGKPNMNYANPSMVSNDVFYEKHYENPNKTLTPPPAPLGILPNGYGKMPDYKDRYNHMSGQNNVTSNDPNGTRDQMRSGLRDNYYNRTERNGAVTPTRSNANYYPDNQNQGTRTPTRREPNLQGERTPSDANRSQGGRPLTPNRHMIQGGLASSGTGAHGHTQQHGVSHTHYVPADKHETRSQVSGSTTLTNAELICDNCINKNLMEEKRAAARAEKQRDEQYQNDLLSRERAMKTREEEEYLRRKERFKQEAIEHWEETKKMKELQKEQDKRNDDANRGLFYDRERTEKEMKDLAEKRRHQLRADLKHQIREKKQIDEQMQRQDDQIANTGLPIGMDYVNRFDRYKDAHKAALKEQIEEKTKMKENEKELDKRLQEQYQQEMRDWQRTEQDRKEQAENARKEHYRQEMERFIEEKEAKKRRDEAERAKDLELDQINKARAKEEEARKQEAIRRREENHLTALRTQMDEAAMRKVYIV